MSELESFLGLTAGFQLCPLLASCAWDKPACSSTQQDDLILSETYICPFFYNIVSYSSPQSARSGWTRCRMKPWYVWPGALWQVPLTLEVG